MSDQKESYKEVFKATSIFGGVQVFNVLISIIRSKVVAVLLGAGGMGVLGILQQPLGIVGLITEMGLGASSVRDIAKAKTSGDDNKISQTVTTVKRWVWVAGIFGMVVVIVLSPLLGKLSNSTDEPANYTWAFIFLSVTLLFSAVSNGQVAVLRGLRRIKETAKVGMIGSGCGLIISLPFYYFYGIKGIVPTLIISSVIVLITSWYFSRKVQLPPVTISYRESFFQGKEMIKLGIIITMTNLISQLVSYIFYLYLKDKAGIEVVGLYNTGWTITNQYVALVFTAMTIDYFPRLISLQSDREKMREAVNQQAEIAILIIAPLMLFFISFLPLIIRLIYTEAFMPIITFIQWMILGMLLKTASWALSHIIVAKGDNRLFFLSEFISSLFFLLFNIGAYALFGLMGVGIAFVLQYTLYLLAMILIAKKRYQITFSKEFIKLFLFQFLMSFLCFLIVIMKGYPLTYIVGGILFIVSAIYSLKELNNRMDLKSILSKIKK